MKSTVVRNPFYSVVPSMSVLVYTLHSLAKQKLGLTRYSGVAPNFVLYIKFLLLCPTGDVSMATVSSPLPPPVKNDWLPSGLDNPRLSPPSPGGPRKPAPTSQVSSTYLYDHIIFNYH